MSYLIALDGTDASGKKTQSDMLYSYFKDNGYKVIEISFPDYDSPSSSLVKMYLNGEFGSSADDTNPYAASSFFAVDRYASFKKNWEKYYKSDDYIILLNRYTTSNAVHQLSKITDDKQREAFLIWLWDFEFVKLSLPVPDLVLFLEMPPKIALSLINSRSALTGIGKDIHEADPSHIEKSHDAALFACERWGWVKIECGKDAPYPREKIHSEILSEVMSRMPSGVKPK